MRAILVSKWTWLLLFSLVIGGTVYWMHRTRQRVLVQFASQGQQQAWDEWRESAAKDQGPVTRRVPKSDQPPTLVLMRDFYAMCLSAMLFFELAVLGFLMVVVRGMLSPSRSTPHASQDASAGP